eukprot:2097944-Alexandrium_andersonii.AAC.1
MGDSSSESGGEELQPAKRPKYLQRRVRIKSRQSELKGRMMGISGKAFRRQRARDPFFVESKAACLWCVRARRGPDGAKGSGN